MGRHDVLYSIFLYLVCSCDLLILPLVMDCSLKESREQNLCQTPPRNMTAESQVSVFHVTVR